MLREVGRVLGKGKGREMEVAIFAGNLGIGPGNVPATPSDEVRLARVLVRAGRGQTNLGLVKVGMVKVLGPRVHVSTASKLDIKQQRA